MNIYLLKSNSRVEPFGDEPLLSPFGNMTLLGYMVNMIKSLGHKPVILESSSGFDRGEGIIICDRVFVTKKLLNDFLKGIDRSRVSMLGVRRTVSSSYNLPIM
ncbi:MAG: hypothetical protein ACPL7I_07810, partial [Myxococcota bacterium]